MNDQPDLVQPRPIAMASQDDRGPEYAAAVARSQAAFDHAREILGQEPRQLDVVGDLAALIAGLPADMPLRTDVAKIVGADATPDHWVTTTVATIVPVLDLGDPPARDHAGREYAVLLPALDLAEWITPDGDASAGEPHAYLPYDRLVEAFEHGGPAGMLAAGGAVLRAVAVLLGDREGPAAYMSRNSEVADDITHVLERISDLAGQLDRVAERAQAEEDADGEDDV